MQTDVFPQAIYACKKKFLVVIFFLQRKYMVKPRSAKLYVSRQDAAKTLLVFCRVFYHGVNFDTLAQVMMSEASGTYDGYICYRLPKGLSIFRLQEYIIPVQQSIERQLPLYKHSRESNVTKRDPMTQSPA